MLKISRHAIAYLLIHHRRHRRLLHKVSKIILLLYLTFRDTNKLRTTRTLFTINYSYPNQSFYITRKSLFPAYSRDRYTRDNLFVRIQAASGHAAEEKYESRTDKFLSE